MKGMARIMKFNVTIARFGSIEVEAESGEQAMAKARQASTGEIDWSDDWEPTDADPTENGTDNGRTPRKVALFDMDGTICSPLFRTENGIVTGFPGDAWKAYCDKHAAVAYVRCEPVLQVLKFANRLKEAGYEMKILTIALSDAAKAGKVEWKRSHPAADAIFDEIIFAADRDSKLTYARAYGEGTVMVDDDLVLLLDAGAAGITPVHVSHVMTGYADRLAGLEEWPQAGLSAVASEAAALRDTCVMANNKENAEQVHRTWQDMGIKNAFLLTAQTPARELSLTVRAIHELQDNGEDVHLACTPMLETGVNLSFRHLYREETTTNHMAQSYRILNRHGRYPARPIRVFRAGTKPDIWDDRTDYSHGQQDARTPKTPDEAETSPLDKIPGQAETMAKAAGEALADAKDAFLGALSQARDSAAVSEARKKLSDAMRKAAEMLNKH